MPSPLPPALVLGALHGVTELLPVSSSAHLALAQMLAGGAGAADLGGPAGVGLLHVGTLAAALVVARKRAWAALEEGLRGLARPSIWRHTRGGRDAVAVVIATVPTALLGLAARGRAEAWQSSAAVLGVGLLVSAAAVGSTVLAPEGERDEPPPRWGALVVGLAQGAAVVPGVSRSGLVLAALLWLGVRRARAFELSLLVSVPAVAAALGLRLEALHGDPRALGGGADLVALAAAAMIAFGAGLLALLALRRVVVGGRMFLFAVYLVPLAVATLAWGYARP